MKCKTLLDCLELLNEADGEPISKAFAQQLIVEAYTAGKNKDIPKCTGETFEIKRYDGC